MDLLPVLPFFNDLAFFFILFIFIYICMYYFFFFCIFFFCICYYIFFFFKILLKYKIFVYFLFIFYLIYLMYLKMFLFKTNLILELNLDFFNEYIILKTYKNSSYNLHVFNIIFENLDMFFENQKIYTNLFFFPFKFLLMSKYDNMYFFFLYHLYYYIKIDYFYLYILLTIPLTYIYIYSYYMFIKEIFYDNEHIYLYAIYIIILILYCIFFFDLNLIYKVIINYNNLKEFTFYNNPIKNDFLYSLLLLSFKLDLNIKYNFSEFFFFYAKYIIENVIFIIFFDLLTSNMETVGFKLHYLNQIYVFYIFFFIMFFFQNKKNNIIYKYLILIIYAYFLNETSPIFEEEYYVQLL